jgi:hypothetical protein
MLQSFFKKGVYCATNEKVKNRGLKGLSQLKYTAPSAFWVVFVIERLLTSLTALETKKDDKTFPAIILKLYYCHFTHRLLWNGIS